MTTDEEREKVRRYWVRRRARQRGETPEGYANSYGAAHRAIYAARGKAREHECACGAPAAEWAYQHNGGESERTETVQSGRYAGGTLAYSTDPSHYAAMCRRCHRAFDKKRRAELATVNV